MHEEGAASPLSRLSLVFLSSLSLSQQAARINELKSTISMSETLRPTLKKELDKYLGVVSEHQTSVDLQHNVARGAKLSSLKRTSANLLRPVSTMRDDVVLVKYADRVAELARLEAQTAVPVAAVPDAAAAAAVPHDQTLVCA